MSVASNPFALTDTPSGSVIGNTVIDAQTGQEILYDPQNGGFSLVPSIFDTNLFNFDPVCLDVSGAAVCIGYIDPQTMSPLPHLTKGTDKLASALTQNDPRDPILPGLADAYADLYFLREVARGERTITDQQEFYLREHAASIAYTRREALADAFSPKAPSSDFLWGLLGFGDPDTSVQDTAASTAVSTDVTSIYGVYGKWQQVPVLILPDDSGTIGLSDLFGDWSVDATGGVVDPFVKSQQRAQNWADGQADREVANYVLKRADRATILRLQLANARIRIRTILENEARESYLDHTEDIAALAKIDDSAKLAGALQDLSSRIVRGKKLKQLQNAAIAVGNEVMSGGRKIDLQTQIRTLAGLPPGKQKEFYEGITKFVADHKIVALAYSLDQLKEIVDTAETAAGKIEHAPPKLSAAERMTTAGPGGGRTGVTMASMRTEGTKTRNELEAYFGGFSSRVSDARALIAKGDVASARTAFKAIQADKSFGEMQTRLTAALGFEEGYRYGQKIGIIIGAAAFAAVGGAYVGAAMLARGAPAWLAGLGSLATEAAIFLAAERVGGKLILGEQIFDPKKGIKGNALHYAGEWIKVMLMFGFLRAGMKTYKGVVDAVVGSRAAKSVVEGVLAKAEKVLKRMHLNSELAGKLARSAKLRAFGKILNHGGAFGAEYTTFTAWDYLIQLHETKGLPKKFFTSKSMVDRLIFLGCLKVGGLASRPFVQPLQAKVTAGQMRRYAGRIDKYNTELESLNKELVEYDASGTVDLARITNIHGRMKKLLKRRAGLEAAILKINPQIAKDHPEFAEGVKRTARAIEEAGAREKEAEALSIIQSGSYTKRQKMKVMAFLKEGARRGRLSYRVNRRGEIRVTYASAQPVTVVVKLASKRARKARRRASIKLAAPASGSAAGKLVINLGASINSEPTQIGTLHCNGVNATMHSSGRVKMMSSGRRRRRVMFYTIRIESRGREFTEAERTAIERKLKPELDEFGIEYTLEYGKSAANNATPRGQVSGALVKGATASGVIGAPRRSAPAGVRVREMGSLAAISVFAPELIGRIAEVSPEVAAVVTIVGTFVGALGMVLQGKVTGAGTGKLPGPAKPVITPQAEGANGPFSKGAKGIIKLPDGREAAYEVGAMDTTSRTRQVKLTVQGALDGAIKAEISRALFGKMKTVVSLDVTEKAAPPPSESQVRRAARVAAAAKPPADIIGLESRTVGKPSADAEPMVVRKPGDTAEVTERHGNLEFRVAKDADGVFGLEVRAVEGSSGVIVKGVEHKAGEWLVMKEGDTVLIDGTYYARSEGALRPVEVGTRHSPILIIQRNGKPMAAQGAESTIYDNGNGTVTKVSKLCKGKNWKKGVGKLDREQDVLTIASPLDIGPKVVGRPSPGELVITKLEGTTLDNMAAAERKAIPPEAWSRLEVKLEQLQKLGIVHNDVHEGNVIWNGKNLKLLDFDSAQRNVHSGKDLADVSHLRTACENGTPWIDAGYQEFDKSGDQSVATPKVSFAGRGPAAGQAAGPRKTPVTKPVPQSDGIPTAPVRSIKTPVRFDASQIPRPSADDMFMKWRKHSVFVNHHAEGTQRREIIDEMSLIDVRKHPELKGLRDSAREFLDVLQDCEWNLRFYDSNHGTKDPAVAEQRYNLLYNDITSQMGQLQRSLAYTKAVALHDSWRTTFEPARERVDQIKEIGRDMGEDVSVKSQYRISDQLTDHYDTDFANIKPNEVLQMVVEVKSPDQAQTFMARMQERGLIFAERVPRVSRESGGRAILHELEVLLQSGEGARFRGETISVRIRVDVEGARHATTAPEPLDKLIVNRPAAEGGPMKLTLKTNMDWFFSTYKYVDPDGKVVSELILQENHILHARTAKGFRHLKLNTRLKGFAAKGRDSITAVITNEALMSILVKDWNASQGMEQSFRLQLLTDSLCAYRPFVRGRKLLGYTDHEVVSVERIETRDSNGKVKVVWNVVVRSSRDMTEGEITDDELPVFMRDD